MEDVMTETDAEKSPTLSTSRRVLVVDDNKAILEVLQDTFNFQKTKAFKDWNISDQRILDVLLSMELVTRHNKDYGSAEKPMDVILNEVVNSPFNGSPFSGIISDYSMPNSQVCDDSLQTPDPQKPTRRFEHNPQAIQENSGGVQLAKIANILQIPLVIFTGGPMSAERAIANTHLKHLKPAKAKVYVKDDYRGIFVGLAKEIVARENSQSASVAR